MSLATYTGTIRDGRIELASLVNLPEGSEVYVVIPSTINEPTAKRSANRWLVGHVGNLLMASNGMLMQTARNWHWRFEVFMTSVNSDPQGPIGTVDIDAETGSILEEKMTKKDLELEPTPPTPNPTTAHQESMPQSTPNSIPIPPYSDSLE